MPPFDANKAVDRWQGGLATWLLKDEKRSVSRCVPDDFESFFLETSDRVYGSSVYPHHLQRLIDILLHRDDFGEVVGQKTVVSMPPRHLKTTVTLLCSLYVLLKHRHTKSLWLTYAEELMRYASSEFDKMASVWSSTRQLAVQKTIGSNTLFMGSLKSPVTGKGANWNIIVDDPLKNMNEALSRQIRESVWSNYDSCATSRAENSDVNYVICGTRWHSDDPQGRAIRQGYEYLHYQAINEAGAALCPELRSLQFLLDKRKFTSSYVWESTYQGNPPDDKFGLFSKQVHYASELNFVPSDIVRHSFGMDLAYTTNSQSDLSAWVHLGLLKTGEIILLDYLLEKCNATHFFRAMRERDRSIAEGEAVVRWYASAQEIALSNEIALAHKIKIEAVPSFGKLGNVQNLSSGWNAGRVYVPAGWINGEGEAPIDQLINFTGNEGDKDDFADAFCAAYDELVPRMGPDDGPDPRMTRPDPIRQLA